MQAQAHTHVLLDLQGLLGLSIDVMVFIPYKLYILSPYTKPTHHGTLLVFSPLKKHHHTVLYVFQVICLTRIQEVL